jgi:Histidine-specific methyltransferase, SAM-dependent
MEGENLSAEQALDFINGKLRSKGEQPMGENQSLILKGLWDKPGLTFDEVLDNTPELRAKGITIKELQGSYATSFYNQLGDALYEKVRKTSFKRLIIDKYRQERWNSTTLKPDSSWLSTFIGENSLQILANFEADIRHPKEPKIQSGLAYLGAIPTSFWIEVCSSPNYLMLASIQTFTRRLERFRLNFLNQGKDYVYLSLGIGGGEKDADICNLFIEDESSKDKFIYIGVDLSVDMLKAGMTTLQNRCPKLPYNNCIALQFDITNPTSLQDVVTFARSHAAKLKNEDESKVKILFGLLGNTIFNFEEPCEAMEAISNMLGMNDFLLFEANVLSESTATEKWLSASESAIRDEYHNRNFFSFARAALLSSTDIDPTSIFENFQVDIARLDHGYGPFVQIDCFYKNTGAEPATIEMLYSGEKMQFEPGKRIRLYRSRKMPKPTLEGFFARCGLSLVEDAEGDMYSDYFPRNSTKGIAVSLLKKRHPDGMCP